MNGCVCNTFVFVVVVVVVVVAGKACNSYFRKQVH